MSDLIDRQAAIDAIERLEIPEDMCVFEILSHIELEIGTLPSAQPEIIRCKDCRFYQPMIDQDDLCNYRLMQVFEDDFCSRAERRTDGTDARSDIG